MKKSLLALVALAALAIPSISMAAPPHVGPYVSGFLGITIPNDADATAFNLNDKIEYDTNINVGGTGGYDFGWVRLEGEVSYKRAQPSRVNDRLTGITYNDISNDGGLGVLAVMGNAFIDVHNPSPITPYFGGGIGFAAIHQSDTLGNSPTFQRAILYQEDDDTVFAYQVGAGLDLTLNKMFSIDLGYRYFHTATAHFNSGTPMQDDLNFVSHNVAVGLRIKF